MKILEYILGNRNPSQTCGQSLQTINEAYVGIYKGLMWRRMATYLMIGSDVSRKEILEEVQRIISDHEKSVCDHVNKSKQDADSEFKSEIISNLKFLKTP